MKKVLILLATIVLFIPFLTSCRSDVGSTADQKLVMATSADFPPFQYKVDGEIVGLDVEIGRAIADRLGYELVVVDKAFDSLIPALQRGEADFVMAAMSVTESRAALVDFSISYYTGRQVIIVGADEADIMTPEDLEGQFIGVQIGTTGDDLATAAFGDDLVYRFSQGQEALDALVAGRVSAVIIDDYPAAEFVEQVEGLRVLDTEFIEEDYAIAFPLDSPYVERFNQVIEELKANGSLQEIVDRFVNTGN